MTPDAMSAEVAFLSGDAPSSPVFPKTGKAKASHASEKIIEFTQKWPPSGEPFLPSYNFANPWATKKDNKGKKERPASVAIRPGLKKDVPL